MAITVYVTEDFGTMKEKDRGQRRSVIHHGSNVRVMEQGDVYHRELERKAHHARNLARPQPNSFQSLLEGIQDRWYSFRLSLSRWISPSGPPACVTRDKAKLRYANTLERRKILEELWLETLRERVETPSLQGTMTEKVLHIPIVETDFLVEDE